MGTIPLSNSVAGDILSSKEIPSALAALSWFTPSVGDKMGYGVAAINTIQALMNRQIYVGYNSAKAKVHVSFVQPEWYNGLSNQYKIGYTPWESTEVPGAWLHYMQEQDEIWTTSQFCVDVFKNAGVHENIRLVPHGIDPEVWQIVDRTLANQFIFLHIGGPAERKGGQRVADAFLDLFGDRDDVYLVMKSNGPSEARWREGEHYYGNINNHPRITVYPNELSTSELVHLYNQAHCLVYPTNGEGFGFIPFQSIATGMPTITTNLTGTADFAEMSMPLKASWRSGEGLHLGDWAEPDLEDLRAQMLSAVDNWEDHKKKAMHSAKVIHSTQTWDHIALRIIDILGDRLYERT